MAKKNSKANKEEPKKDDMLEKLVRELEKNHGQGSVMLMGKNVNAEEIKTISSGCLSLDIALGIGGFPRGRIIEVFGNESSGKTTLALQALSQVQKVGGVAAIVDAEHALDTDYAKKLGIDIDKLILSQPDFGEQALEIVDSLVRSNMVDMIVVDSVAALVPKTEIEGSMGDAHVGLQARLMSQALRKLAGSISKSKAIVLFINQVRMKIGVMYGNPETTTGGVALKFYSTIRIEVRKNSLIREGKDAIGNETTLKVVKNKVAPPFREAKVDMIYGQGIAKEYDIFNIAVEEDIVQKKGAWFSYVDYEGNEVSLGQGKMNAIGYFLERPELLEYLELKIREKKGIKVPQELQKSVESFIKVPSKKSNSSKSKELEEEIEEISDNDEK